MTIIHGLLKRIWIGWKRVGQFIGDLIARIVLTLFYFTVLVPFGLGVRLLSDRSKTEQLYKDLWIQRQPRSDDLLKAGRLY